ncbi:MAG TPA: DUF1579 family protein, partial [Flavisolibacter sp.]
MKSLTIAFCAAVTLLATPSYAQKEKAKPAAATDKDKAEVKLAAMPDEQTMMKNWQAYMTPGKEHKLMASWDGTWEGETTMWMTPGAPPSKSTGTATHRTIY